jgi:hypothetical protein
MHSTTGAWAGTPRALRDSSRAGERRGDTALRITMGAGSVRPFSRNRPAMAAETATTAAEWRSTRAAFG